MKLVVFHLLNDFSGSPKVLQGVIERMLGAGNDVRLYTSRGGPLDSLCRRGLKRHVIPYRFSQSKFMTLIRYATAQMLSFACALRYAFSKDTEFYINTILPVGAALGARLAGKRVTLHCHENPATKSRAYLALAGVMLRLADRVVCVSAYQADRLAEHFPRLRNPEIVPNTLSADFTAALRPDPAAAFERKNVLMLTSLKAYKGMREFINLASLLPEYRFTLVVNDTAAAIDAWLASNGIPPAPNVTIHPRQNDVSCFYNSASVVINLSNPRLFVETFGMTALEAHAAGLPVIAPTVGGIAELVTDGRDGFLIDCHDTPRLLRAVKSLLSDRDLYMRMAHAALGQHNRHAL